MTTRPGKQQIFSHKASPDFWILYHRLPQEIRELADKNYKFLKENPQHPSLRLKKVGKVWSIRIGLSFRAIATEIPEGLLWIWIGHHDQYNRIIN